jgi:DNA polymerase-3 subunit epsilon
VNPFPFPLQRPLTFFDLETTSKYAKTARIVEIAIVQYRPEEPPTEYWTLVNPGVPIPADVTAIHGIGDEHVLDKRRFEELANHRRFSVLAADAPTVALRLHP